MIKIYKVGFFVFIIIIFTLVNALRITKSNYKEERSIFNLINSKRMTSLFLSNNVYNRRITSITGENIITKQKANIFTDRTLVILLSDFKCSKCQEKELRRLDSLISTLAPYGIHILGLTTKYKKGLTARQKKIAKIKLPIYWINDDTFNNLSFSTEYPQILYIADSIIISAFKPITMDDEFSENYYKHLMPSLKKSL